jgi:hypothetical protein
MKITIGAILIIMGVVFVAVGVSENVGLLNILGGGLLGGGLGLYAEGIIKEAKS